MPMDSTLTQFINRTFMVTNCNEKFDIKADTRTLNPAEIAAPPPPPTGQPVMSVLDTSIFEDGKYYENEVRRIMEMAPPAAKQAGGRNY
eukprot:gene2298-7460_t